jgi:hypothetical protein
MSVNTNGAKNNTGDAFFIVEALNKNRQKSIIILKWIYCIVSSGYLLDLNRTRDKIKSIILLPPEVFNPKRHPAMQLFRGGRFAFEKNSVLAQDDCSYF